MTRTPVVPTLQDPTTGNRPPGGLFGASCERQVRKVVPWLIGHRIWAPGGKGAIARVTAWRPLASKTAISAVGFECMAAANPSGDDWPQWGRGRPVALRQREWIGAALERAAYFKASRQPIGQILLIVRVEKRGRSPVRAPRAGKVGDSVRRKVNGDPYALWPDQQRRRGVASKKSEDR
jgi:hypothetical protein